MKLKNITNPLRFDLKGMTFDAKFLSCCKFNESLNMIHKKSCMETVLDNFQDHLGLWKKRLMLIKGEINFNNAKRPEYVDW